MSDRATSGVHPDSEGAIGLSHTSEWYQIKREFEAAASLHDIDDTDLANARRLALIHGNDIRFVPELGWLVWDGRRWINDPSGVRLQQFAKQTAEHVAEEIRSAADQSSKRRHARRSQSKVAIDAMIGLVKSEPGIAINVDSLDRDPWLLNLLNGTLNLKSRELLPHRRDDLITKLAPVEWDSNADFDQWDCFITRVTGGDDDLYQYLRRAIGYHLTGTTTEQVLHFLHGQGANGKSVFCDVFLDLLGDYAMVASPEMIIQQRYSGIPNDIARLRGMRVVMMNETSQGSAFNEAKLKELTGGDKLTGRFLYKESFDFTATHKLIIRGNHKPSIHGSDDGIWRRLRLIPFSVTIPEQERDPNLSEKLKAERSGILRWAAEGCWEWLEEKVLQPPVAVVTAGEEYRAESDVLGRFLDECCLRRNLAQVRSSVFFQRYKKFCESHDERPFPSKDLATEMSRRGFDRKRQNSGWLFIGVEMLEEQDHDRRLD